MDVIVQGATGKQGSFHTRLMVNYGTNVVAGVTPGKAGRRVAGVPIYNSIQEALQHHEAVASIVFVPAMFAKKAILEAIENELKLIVVITEHIPVHDVLECLEFANQYGSNVIGPNTPGIMVPDRYKLGIMPSTIFQSGNIGVVSRSGTLTYEIVYHLTQNNLGQSICVGIGGDRVVGKSFVDVLEMFQHNSKTKAIVLIGEIGGSAEERAATYINQKVTKPVVAFIAGITAPIGKKMGHAGAIIEEERGSALNKIKAFQKYNIPVAKTPKEVAEKVRALF